MPNRSRSVILFILAATLALGVRASLVASGGGGTDLATLKKIGSRIDDRTGVITIEATVPVPYVASQPDPRTFIVELRDVVASVFSDAFKADPRSPVSAVQVENTRAIDGVSVARVKMTLTQAIRPRVRSSRNVIYVETDRLDRAAPAAGAAGAGAGSAIRDVRVTMRGTATAITLFGTGRLVASGVEETRDGAAGIVVNLPNVTSSVPNVVPIGQGPVERVRISPSAGATRVALDMSRKAPYRLESSTDGQDLTVVFDETAAADPISALIAPQPARPEASSVLAAGKIAVSPAPAAPQQTAVAVPVQPLQAAAQQAQAPAPPVAAPTPGQQPGPAGTVPGAAPTRYTGHPISLDFQGADLRAVLRTFSEISGLNVVIDPTIQGTVDVSLRDVPWDQALDIILRANKLGYQLDGTIVRIAPLSVLSSELKEQQTLADSQKDAGELVTVTRMLSYAKAEDISALLKSAQVLSSRGNPSVDTRTNTVIVTDLATKLDGIRDLINTLDQPQPQVEIEARIVQTSRTFARTLGVQWGFNGRADPAIGNTLPMNFPNSASVGGRSSASPAAPRDNMVNLGATAATSAIGVAVGSINGAVNLDLALSALERSGKGRILSTPRVATQNNVEAEITQGVQIPIQTVANNTVTVTFKDAALTLRVIPQITAANTVIMRISVENASPDNGNKVNGIPPINTQRAITQVLVSNGETTVIGGIYISQEQATQDRTPGLYRLPLLGWLFKRDDVTDESRELLIFITPRIQRL